MSKQEQKTPEQNQQELREKIEELGITQYETAEILSKATSRKISYRAVKSWLAKSSVVSSRPCPEWAIKVLKKHNKENETE